MLRLLPLVLSLWFMGTTATLVQAYEIAHEGEHHSDEPTSEKPASETAEPTDAPTDTPTDDAAPDDTEDEPEATPPEESDKKPQSATTSTPATLAGQCRLTNRRVSIFSEPSVGPDSTMLNTIAPQAQVTLASDGKDGWIQISQPTAGHVIARYLTFCPTDSSDRRSDVRNPVDLLPIHPTLTNLSSGACRRAVEDLAIRSAPNRETSNVVGSVKEDQTMTLTGRSEIESESQRVWLQLSQPRSGWVSGGIESWTNVELCR